MWILYLSIVLLYSSTISDAAITSITLKNERNYSLTTHCVQSIIERYYKTRSGITFVNFRSKDMNILSHIHAMGSVSVVNRKPFTKMLIPNKGYLIYAQTAEDFLTEFRYLLTEKMWMPYAPFLIVVQVLDAAALRDMFQELLRAHVKDAIIIDGSTTYSYTYDTYENNGCGKRFDRIINLGKCLAEMPPGHFRQKLANGLRNCTIKVAITHWPPYGVEPAKSKVEMTGIDEYLFTLIAKHEHFKVDVKYVDGIADQVSVVNDDMVADGPLRWLQTNEYDVVTGGVTLLLNRATAFTYIYMHSAYDDEFRIIVRQAGDKPRWKILFLEFAPLVWLLLLLSFITVAVLILCITRPKDKTLVILSLFDNLLQHSYRLRRTRKIKLILIFWIIFASLITSHYLSDLVGLSTKMIPDYQIHNVYDLEKYGVQPCTSTAIRQVLHESPQSALDVGDFMGRGPGCDKLRESLETVSKSPDLFTVVPYCLYYFERYKYCDESGRNLLYSFRQPLSKIIYASYMSKGFPLYDEFHMLSLRVREAGLVRKLWDDYEYAQKKYYNVTQETSHPQFYLPMYVIVFGWVASTFCCIGELLVNLYNQAHVLNT